MSHVAENEVYHSEMGGVTQKVPQWPFQKKSLFSWGNIDLAEWAASLAC